MILFRNCRLVKALTEGFDGEYADVLVDDNHVIAQIGAPGEIKADCRTVDAGGNTLLPGFFDLHAHLCLTDLDFKELRNRSAVDSCYEMYDYAREYLKQGYTTIRDAGCPFNVTAGLSKAAAKGYINVPEIISSGLIITPTEIGNDTFSSLYYPA